MTPAAADVRESLRLERTIKAPAQARLGLEPLREHLDPDRLEDVRLLVSELVTNSVLYAGEPGMWVEVHYGLADGRLRVEVVDAGPGFTAPSHDPELEDLSGRGLFLVRALSDRWGVAGSGVTRVWFEIDPSVERRSGASLSGL